MRRTVRYGRGAWVARGLAVASVTAILAGCNWDEHDYDHEPPAGQGAIIVDNRSSEDVNVYLDGEPQPETRRGHDRAYDLNPGLHRLVLDEQGGDRYAARDVDVLEGRRTVVEIQNAYSDYRDYDLFVQLD